FYVRRDDAPGVPLGRHRSPAAPAGMAAPVAGGRGGGGGHGTDGGTGGRRGGPAGAPAASLAGKSSTGRSRNTSRIVATQMGRAARAPVSSGPRLRTRSCPTHTPAARVGV